MENVYGIYVPEKVPGTFHFLLKVSTETILGNHTQKVSTESVLGNLKCLRKVSTETVLGNHTWKVSTESVL